MKKQDLAEVLRRTYGGTQLLTIAIHQREAILPEEVANPESVLAEFRLMSEALRAPDARVRQLLGFV